MAHQPALKRHAAAAVHAIHLGAHKVFVVGVSQPQRSGFAGAAGAVTGSPSMGGIAGTQIVEITDAMTGAKLDAARFKDFRTIDGLFDFIQEAINRNAESIQVTYDPTYAYPTSVSIDYIKQAVDEEMAFKASDLKAM